MTLRHRAHRLFHAERREDGLIAIAGAVLLTVVILATAMSVDLGGRVVELRREQATADLAALDASRDLTSNANTQALAAASALRNGVDSTLSGNTVAATLGTWNNGVFTPGGSGSAVKVSVTTPYHDFFGGTSSSMTKSAIAQNAGNAQFSVGSTLAEVNLGLGKFGSVSLGLVGYNGLASGNVTLGALATSLGFSALTPDQVLNSSVSTGQLAGAAATLLSANNPTASANVSTLSAALLALSYNSTNKIKIGDALNLQQGSGVGLGTSVNLLQLISGSVQLANQKAGIALNLGLAGVGGVSITGLVPASTSPYGPVGVTATNTQVTANVTINTTLTVGISLYSITLPITLTLGGATGTLTAIDCTGNTPTDIKLASTFKSVDAVVASGSSVKLLGLQVATVSGDVLVPSNPVGPKTVNDPANFIPNNAPVTASSSLGTPVANLNLSVLVFSTSLLNALIGPIVGSIVSTTSSLLASTLGISVGNADYLGIQAACAIPQLVH